MITLELFIPVTGISNVNTDVVFDGPYFFVEDNKLTALVVKNGFARIKEVTSENFSVFKKKYNLRFNYNDILEKYHVVESDNASYSTDGSIAIMADLHGEYNNYIRLLKNTGIIDRDLNWSFGDGHLVILGDIFDRGSMVTEILWHLYGLEIQASAAGGKVHILLGNHEFLILTGDCKFINNKYIQVEQITGKTYSDLFLSNSVLGNWLRKMPVIVRINNILFTHAGISNEMVRRKIDKDQMNRIFSNHLTKGIAWEPDTTEKSMIDLQVGHILSYRGYFADMQFSENKLDSILSFYGVDRIIVGHTTLAEVKSMYNNKLIGIDAGLMHYHSGEILLYQNDTFYRVLYNGKREILFK
jgi:hypothetical protein